jgi:hypothetical protein
MTLQKLMGVDLSISTDVGVWPWIDGTGIRLGSGFDTLRCEVCASAVIEIGSTTEDQSTGQKVTYTVLLVESEREFRESLSINASASFKGFGGRASARLEVYKSVKLNSQNVFLMTWVTVVNATQSIHTPALKDDARNEWLTAREGNKRANFVKIYGDTFVSSVTGGGEMIAIYELAANSSEERERIKLSVRASIGSFSSSVDYERAVEELNKHRQQKLTVVRDGGLGELPELTPGAILKASREFPNLILANPVPIAFETQRYSRVPDQKSSIDVEAIDASRRIEDLAAANDDVQERIATMKLVSRNITLYDEVDEEEVGYQLDKLEDMEVRLRRLAEDVGRNRYIEFGHNDFPTVNSLPSPPRQTPGQLIPLNIKIVGMVGFQAVDREGASGEWVAKDCQLMSMVLLCDSLPNGLKLQYMGYLRGIGDSNWCDQGTQTPFAFHEGISIRLAGVDSERYLVSYQVKVTRTQASFYGQNGSYAGIKGRNTTISGIRIVLRLKA